MSEKRDDFKVKGVEPKEDGTFEAVIETPEGVDVKVPPKK
ncbi:hypothetical protein HB162lentus_04080 [Mammaliicoccus lentus]